MGLCAQTRSLTYRKLLQIFDDVSNIVASLIFGQKACGHLQQVGAEYLCYLKTQKDHGQLPSLPSCIVALQRHPRRFGR